MDLNLKDHTVIVVGGASGIGLATARSFAAEGAHVALWDRSENVSDIAREVAKEHSVRSIGIPVDVTDEPAVASALVQTIKVLGHVDHLIHAAAIGSGKFGFPFTNLTPADWPRVLSVNVMGMTNVAYAIAPHMTERKAGTMVFVASVAGQIGSQTDPPYSASKAANINFAQCMAKDLAPHRVRVNTVCPGMVQTPLNRSVWQAWHDQTPAADQLSYEEWADRKIRAVVPLGKWQTAEAIADMIVFLSSNRAEHVTGQTINVDGGFVMHW
ncbi:MAG TPA: SDR family oxidoreductase [Humisphaera sp.]|nr:SDR family oxidoreductase [Humisphaera sp.]